MKTTDETLGLEAERMRLENEKSSLNTQIGEIEAALMQNKMDWEKYRIASSPGWFPKTKLKEVKLKNRRREVNLRLQDIAIQLGAAARMSVGEHFIQAARDRLPHDEFRSLLDEAETRAETRSRR